MLGSARLSAMSVALMGCLALGCSSQSPTVPNPFNTADRVPPPMLRVPSAGGAAYYPEAAAPTYGAAYGTAPAPAYGGAAPAYGSPPSTFAPAPASSVAPGPAPAAGMATPYYGASVERRATTPGDAISVPTDSGSLRFATRDEALVARRESQPVPRSNPTMLAASSAAPTRRTATANGWIAGSAPVRPSTPAASPRVRIPGETFVREPVSLAAINRAGAVPIAPLEPAPTGSRAGEPAPLRVATPSTGTGWR